MRRILSVLLCLTVVINALFWLPADPVAKADEGNGGSAVQQASFSSGGMQYTPEIGAKILFGKYEQDGNSANGPEEIEWIVLDVRDNQAFVISRYALDSVKFHAENDDDITWERSDMRQWLNEEFYQTAFDDAERTAILKTLCRNEAEKSHRDCAYAGPDTEDFLFLLSIYQADFFFATDEDRKVTATPYAKKQGVLTHEDGTCEWHLRSAGGAAWQIAFVDNEGSLGTYSAATHADVATRPAMWICLDALQPAAVPQTTEEQGPGFADVEGGDLLPTRSNGYALPFEHYFGESMSSNQYEYPDLTLLGFDGSNLYLEREDDNGLLLTAGYYFPIRTSLSQGQEDYKQVQELLSQECTSMKEETRHTGLINALMLLAVLTGGREWDHDHYYDEEYGVHIEHVLFQWGEDEYRHTITYVVDDLSRVQQKLQQETQTMTAAPAAQETPLMEEGEAAYGQAAEITTDRGSYLLTVDNIHEVDWPAATVDMPGVKIVTVQCVVENISFSGIFGNALSTYEIAADGIALVDDEGFSLAFYDVVGEMDGIYEVGAKTEIGKKKRVSLPFFAPESCAYFRVMEGSTCLAETMSLAPSSQQLESTDTMQATKPVS